MENKTCGECRFYHPIFKHEGVCIATSDLSKTCDFTRGCAIGGVYPKPPSTNGDKIRQGSNRTLAEIFDDLYNGNKCKYCIHHAGSGVCKLNPTPYSEYDEGYLDDEDCLNGFEAWLNAPAECEVKDER